MSSRVPLTLRAAALALLAAAPASAQRMLRPADIDALPSKPADARIAYGPDSMQFGDLRLPPGDGPFPVAIVIHGGCWVERYASVRNSSAIADALRDAGVATWNVEYRRADSRGGGWPNTFIDVAMAAEHLREVAKAHPLDLTRVVTVGHSAGGHLALWLAALPRVPASSPVARANPLPIHGVVGLASIADLRGYRAIEKDMCGEVVDALMGGAPDAVPERFAAGSPAELLPTGVPQVQVVGTLDRVMPPAARDDWAAKVRASGDAIDLVVLEGLGHHEVMSPRTAAFPAIRDAVLRFARPKR
jgi:acetyl esterase/lipase